MADSLHQVHVVNQFYECGEIFDILNTIKRYIKTTKLTYKVLAYQFETSLYRTFIIANADLVVCMVVS